MRLWQQAASPRRVDSQLELAGHVTVHRLLGLRIFELHHRWPELLESFGLLLAPSGYHGAKFFLFCCPYRRY
jgi:hypothetical protein